MKQPNFLTGAFVWISLVAIASTVQANLVVNGDFESTSVNGTTPDGWIASGFSVSGPQAYTGNPVVPPASGSWALDLGPSGTDANNGGTASQTFNVAAAGMYTFSFDYTNERNSTSFPFADFSWSLSGAATDSATLLGVGGAYQTFSNSYLINAPGNVTVSFTDIVGNGHSYDAVIDNVSFTAVPEPTSFVMFCAALLAGARRRRVG